MFHAYPFLGCLRFFVNYRASCSARRSFHDFETLFAWVNGSTLRYHLSKWSHFHDLHEGHSLFSQNLCHLLTIKFLLNISFQSLLSRSLNNAGVRVGSGRWRSILLTVWSSSTSFLHVSVRSHMSCDIKQKQEKIPFIQIRMHIWRKN